MSAIKSCDSLLKMLIFSVCLKSWMNGSLCLWFSNFSINLLTLFSRFVFCCSTAESELQIICDPRCCYRFHHNLSNRLMVPKMIMRLGFVDLVDHISSSIFARLVALSELSEPSGRAHPQFSYIPLSRCKLQAVCWGERQHVTVSGKFAGLSLGRAENCTKTLYLEGVSKYSCIARSLVSGDRMEFHRAIYILRRVHCSEEYCLSSSLEAFSSWN